MPGAVVVVLVAGDCSGGRFVGVVSGICPAVDRFGPAPAVSVPAVSGCILHTAPDCYRTYAPILHSMPFFRRFVPFQVKSTSTIYTRLKSFAMPFRMQAGIF